MTDATVYKAAGSSNQVHNKMATYLQNQFSVDIAADSSSCDSLSFAGLLSIQDLRSMSSQTDAVIQIKRQEQEFEFDHITPDSAAQAPSKTCPANISVSRGQLLLQEFLYQSKQVKHKPGSKGATRSNNKRLIDGNNNNTKVSDNQNHKAVSNLSLGQILQSFVSPCKECHAHKPSIKAHTVPQKNCQVTLD